MKYKQQYCTKCAHITESKDWDAATRKYMQARKMDMRTFKSIREAAGQWHRNYVCPNCEAVVNMKAIIGRL